MTPLSAEALRWLSKLPARDLLAVQRAANYRADRPLREACLAERARRSAIDATDTLVSRVAEAAREGAVTGDALRRAGR